MDNNNVNAEGQRKRRKKRPNPLKPLIVRWKLDGEASSNAAEPSEIQENPVHTPEHKSEKPQWSFNTTGEPERVDRKRRYSVASGQEFLQAQHQDNEDEVHLKRRRLMSVPDVAAILSQPNQIQMNDRNIPPANQSLWAATPLNDAQLADLNQRRRKSLGDLFCPDVSSSLSKYITDRNRMGPNMPFVMPLPPLIVPDGSNPGAYPQFNISALNVPREHEHQSGHEQHGQSSHTQPAAPLPSMPAPQSHPKLTDLLNSAEQSDASLSVLAAVCNDKQTAHSAHSAGKSSAESAQPSS